MILFRVDPMGVGLIPLLLRGHKPINKEERRGIT